MKIIKSLQIAFIFGLTVSTACAQTDSQLQKEISDVESGLIPPVRFAGERSWDIASPMKFYNIPGVSMAVIKDSKVIWSFYRQRHKS